MKKLMAVGTLGLVGLLVAGAEARTHKAGGMTTKRLTGCLEKGDEANTFNLTHVAGEGDWELIGAPASLKMSDHVGHKVEVSGRAVSAAAAAKAEGKAGEKKEMKEEKGEHHLRVASLKHVAPTCP
jgi:hypothetical protein